MTVTVLQNFLRESLLDLDGDDSRLQRLQEAATALSGDFTAQPLRIAFPALFAALRQADDQAGNWFDHTAMVVENHWSTYKSAFKGGRATTLYRAVALQGLVEAIGREPRLGTAVALLLRNLRSELPIGKYESAVQMVVDAAEAAFASEHSATMASVAEVKPVLAAAAKSIKVERAALQKRIDAAVGPNNRAGQPTETPNAHWSSAGNPWSHDFSDRLTAIIGDYVDFAISEAAKLDVKNQAVIGGSIAAVAVIDPAVKRSARLLWWRQALYSESAKRPYRSLPFADVIVHAVIDLATHIPPAYEPGLDSFLMETILALSLGSEKSDISGLEAVAALGSTELTSALKYVAPAGLAISKLSRKETSELIAQPSLLPQHWAVWLMRELMAVRAVEAIQEGTETSGGEE